VPDSEAIRGWMTIPYLARTYHIPEEYLFEQLHIPPEGNRDKSLRQLNAEYFDDEPGDILKPLRDAIRHYQPPKPPPSPEAGHD